MSPEAEKAWSQNLGHSGVLATFTSYCAVIGELILAPAKRPSAPLGPGADPLALAALAASMKGHLD